MWWPCHSTARFTVHFQVKAHVCHLGRSALIRFSPRPSNPLLCSHDYIWHYSELEAILLSKVFFMCRPNLKKRQRQWPTMQPKFRISTGVLHRNNRILSLRQVPRTSFRHSECTLPFHYLHILTLIDISSLARCVSCQAWTSWASSSLDERLLSNGIITRIGPPVV